MSYLAVLSCLNILQLCVIFIVVQTNVVISMKDMRKRKYQEDFIKVGFTSLVINGSERPQYIICFEVLANESFNVNKLMRHLKTKHGFSHL
jgi:predicted transcriptional regulator